MGIYPATGQCSLAATSAATRIGTTVTGGVANTKGNYVDFLTLSAQAEGLFVRVREIATANTDNGVLLDVVYDDDGAGTNLVTIAPNLNASAAAVTSGNPPRTHGKTFPVPCRVPTGKHVKVRLQGAQASQTAQVAVWAMQSVQHMENVGVITTYGAVTASSRGTTTPEGTDAYGAWTEIATTGADHELFMVGYDHLGDTTALTNDVLVKIGYGATAPGSGGTEIAWTWSFSQTNAEDIAGPYPDVWVYAAVSSGTKLWAAIAASGTENRGITIHAASGDAIAGGAAVTYPQLIGTGPLVRVRGI